MKINLKTKKFEKLILVIIFLEIFLLMNMITSQSYFIHESFDEKNKKSFAGEVKQNLGLGINLIIGFLTINIFMQYLMFIRFLQVML